MKQLSYDVKGENIYEVLTLKYDSQILYQGYVDDLVTSAAGNLELKLNYGEKTIYPVIARRYGEKILWLPTMPLKEAYNYIPMIFSLDQFTNLWETLKYDPQEDLEIVKDANLLDLKAICLRQVGD